MFHRWIGRVSTAMAFGVSTVAGMTASAADAEKHLAAGEFAVAAVANSELPASEQSELTALINAARKETGSLSREVAGKPAPKSLQGSGADFQSLMMLIQDQTTGPWRDVTGVHEDGSMTPFESGIRVDAKGVLTRTERRDNSGALAGVALAARTASANDDVQQSSSLRMVSLTRLEKEVADRIARGEHVPDSMKQLAGLSEIRYVFVDAESRDIVIAGPAEGWQEQTAGSPVGVVSGRPTLRLDDLVTVLRTYEAQGRQMFGCSIDPRAEGLQAVKAFVEASQAAGPLAPGGASRFAKQTGDALGRQDITVYGVPSDSRVARVLVEADYRMKLIGVGKLDGGKNIPSYFELLSKNPGLAKGGLDALRWWMTLNTEEVLHTADHTAFEIRGTSVRCQSENQFITETGGRASTGKAEPVNRQFAEAFTRHYAELASTQPVFADLEGVFDLAMVAALIQHEQLDKTANWNRGAFASEGSYRTYRYARPKEVDSVVNHRVLNGKDVVVQVAGGVRADVLAVVTSEDVRKESSAPAEVASKSKASSLPAGRWWWDASR